jgi:radical SAM superfamily enzyme YgiQ (UPF0313 family)
MEPLVFATLSSLTPPDVERRLYDERVEEIPREATADLVALTVDTFSAKRSYQIAAEYRRRGIPVVLGGYHPSLFPAEASGYADAVVIGDAEDTWPQVVADLRDGNLRPVYRSRNDRFSPVPPDRSIFRDKRYAPVCLIEAHRGCRYSCDFCSIRAMYPGGSRPRPLEYVLRDVDGSGGRHLFFTDDNLFAEPAYFEPFLEALARRGKRWSCQISADVTRRPELVSAMARAGCVSVTVGFESLERDNLGQMNKSWMQDDFGHIVSVFRKNRIMVYGTFILGYDHDTRAVFDRTLEFALRARLFLANFNPLMPTPGTPLYARLETEGRLSFDRWWLHEDYRWGDCVFRPSGMTGSELSAGCFELRKRFNTLGSILKRSPGLPWSEGGLYRAKLFLAANLVSRRELHRKYGKRLGGPETVPGAPAVSLQKEGGAGCT